MTVKVELTAAELDRTLWSGALDTLADLTEEDCERILDMMDDGGRVYNLTQSDSTTTFIML